MLDVRRCKSQAAHPLSDGLADFKLPVPESVRVQVSSTSLFLLVISTQLNTWHGLFACHACFRMRTIVNKTGQGHRARRQRASPTPNEVFTFRIQFDAQHHTHNCLVSLGRRLTPRESDEMQWSSGEGPSSHRRAPYLRLSQRTLIQRKGGGGSRAGDQRAACLELL